MTHPANPGESRAWELLAAMKPEDVCRAAVVSHDAASSRYSVKSFNMAFHVSVANRTISSVSPGSDALLAELGCFFRLSLLWYLASAKDIACTGRFIRLENTKGGDIFTRGSHVLPLGPLAGKFGRNKEGFLEKGKSLGGEPEKIGDAAIRLFPLPRVPVVLCLRLEDDEFPSRADLLFDSTCVLHIPMDILWSVAMTSLLLMI